VLKAAIVMSTLYTSGSLESGFWFVLPFQVCDCLVHMRDMEGLDMISRWGIKAFS
jgi:hypothetical protein